MESRYIHKRHNVSVVMYHVVCAAKYRRVVMMSKQVDAVLKETCLEMQKRWEIVFLEIGLWEFLLSEWSTWQSCSEASKRATKPKIRTPPNLLRDHGPHSEVTDS